MPDGTDDRAAAVQARLDGAAAAGWVLSVRRDGRTVVVDPPTVQGYLDALGPAPTADEPAVAEVVWTRRAGR